MVAWLCLHIMVSVGSINIKGPVRDPQPHPSQFFSIFFFTSAEAFSYTIHFFFKIFKISAELSIYYADINN